MFDPRERFQPIANFAFLFFACLLLCGVASAAPSIALSKKSGPPTSGIRVSGRGFEPNVGVDIYFDTKDEALVVTNGKGEFHDTGIHASRSARPGEHWVTALERNNDKGAQEPFLVQTNWSQFHFDADGTRLNPYENVLSVHNVGNVGLKWSYTTGKGNEVLSSPAVATGVVSEEITKGYTNHRYGKPGEASNEFPRQKHDLAVGRFFARADGTEHLLPELRLHRSPPP
jgi:hypothetical protein